MYIKYILCKKLCLNTYYYIIIHSIRKKKREKKMENYIKVFQSLYKC